MPQQQYNNEGKEAVHFSNNEEPIYYNNIKLYSNEVHEIITNKPNWILRNGITVLIVVIITLITSTFFISYPDIVKAPAKIVGINTPKSLFAKADGNIEKLFVSNDSFVIADQNIAVLQSTADYLQIFELERWIYDIEKKVLSDNIEILQHIPIPLLTTLGDIQLPFDDFKNKYNQTLQIFGNGYYQLKKQSLFRELQLISELQSSSDRQKLLTQKDYSIQKSEYDALAPLVEQRVIAPLDFNKQKSSLINKEQSLEQMTANLITNAALSESKKKEILDIQKSITDIKQTFQTSLMNLKSLVSSWKDKYVITAPENGKLQYVFFLQENVFIYSRQEVFYVLPSQPSYYAEAFAPQQSYGKLKMNQKVIIKLDAYPYNEFGTISGKISFLPSVPYKDTTFIIKLLLPMGLTSNYHKQLLFKNNMTGFAEIVTDDVSLFDRILYQFRTIFNNR
jgi:HlyD family secretion protein